MPKRNAEKKTTRRTTDRAEARRSTARSTARAAATKTKTREPRRRAAVHAVPTDPPEEIVIRYDVSPDELYRREKARRLAAGRITTDPLEEAKREYKALLAAEAGTPRGGRPRKVPAKPADAAEPDE